MICYEKLINTNKAREEPEQKFHLPFAIFQTKDNNQHIEVNMDENRQSLFIGSEYIFEMRGDIDLLMETPHATEAKYQVKSLDALKAIAKENADGRPVEEKVELYDRIMRNLSKHNIQDIIPKYATTCSQ